MIQKKSYEKYENYIRFTTMAFQLKTSLQTNADVQDHALPSTSSVCLVHSFREEKGMPYKNQKFTICDKYIQIFE